MCWEIIDSGTASAEANMAKDAELLAALIFKKNPIIHFYDWAAPSFTYGHFIKLDSFIAQEKMAAHGVEGARRPTGGGIVFHIWDFAFSILVPACDFRFSQNSLANYDFVNQTVLRAVEAIFHPTGRLELTKEDGTAWDASCFNFCMAKPTKYDVLCDGKKIIGAAQRKTRHGFLHQGTISLITPDLNLLEELLLPGTKVLEAIRAHTHPLLAGGQKDLKEARSQLRIAIEQAFTI